MLLVEASGREPVAPRFSKIALPGGTSSKFQILRFQKLRSRTRQFVLIISVSSKIALPLETSLNFRQSMFIRVDQNCTPVRTIRTILIIHLQKSRSRSRHPRNFVDLSSSKSIKMTLPCGAFGKFRSCMNDDVEGFYTSSIPNERRSRWLSGA